MSDRTHTTSHATYLAADARIGIINRGEAALRFIRAAKEYNELERTGLTTVALFLDSEENAPFVRAADDCVRLSTVFGYPGNKSTPYLDHDLLLAALRMGDCDGVWVGWGFVSEDAEFAAKIEETGIVFLGPSSSAMDLLGDKIAAKALAESADVPILPWSKRAVESVEDAAEIATRIGYPVIIKAANAGGGRGIRFVLSEDKLAAQYASAVEETIRITGGDTVFIEALVVRGRHLEVQALADLHGNINTFGVRDCSVQRKNQKIIEETPPPNLDPSLTREIEESAARLIRAAEYAGAGTVEYLYDLDRRQFFFMEVNTRLQVEHPITEQLYGIDLVKGQIDVAMGREVRLNDRTPRGHVIEARLNAEDPDNEFCPSPGTISLLSIPAGPGIRVDSGVEQGNAIPPEFDSMIAKIISSGSDRLEALARLRRALAELKIGIRNGTTNRSFLLDLLSHPDIVKGGVHTGFVTEHLQVRERKVDAEKTRLALLAGAIELYNRQYDEDLTNFSRELSLSGRPKSLPKTAGTEVSLTTRGRSYTFLVRHIGHSEYQLCTDDYETFCTYTKNEPEDLLVHEGKRHNVLIVPRGDTIQCEIDGAPILLESESGGYVRAPSPAVILSVNTSVGSQVKSGDILLVVEAMKMEILIEAPEDGIITDVYAGEGEQVAAGQPLLQIDSSKTEEDGAEDESEDVFADLQNEHGFAPEILGKELQAAFLGYDHGTGLEEVIGRLTGRIINQPELIPGLLEDFITIMENFAAVEGLFIQREINAPMYSRPVTYQELLSHYFRRGQDKEKGLPGEFLEILDRALALFPNPALSTEDRIDRAFFHIFRSHANLALKQKLLSSILQQVEEFPVDYSYRQRISSALDEVVSVSHPALESLTDIAIHARYMIIDRDRLMQEKRERRESLDNLIESAVNDTWSEELCEQVAEECIEADPSVCTDLVLRYLSAPEERRSVLLEIIGRRINRDRMITDVSVRSIGDVQVQLIQGTTNGTDVASEFCSLTVVLPLSSLDHIREIGDWIDEYDCGGRPEVLILVQGCDSNDTQRVFDFFVTTNAANAKWVCIGVFCQERYQRYRTYQPDGEDRWVEIESCREFDPLRFRELRIARLQNFTLTVLHQTDTCILVEAKAKDDPKDIRLMAFGSFTEISPELEDSGKIRRMVRFEAVFMEAVFAMRAAQAEYRYRLQWNRIILHNRSLLQLGLKQIQKYGGKFLSLAKDLGIERFVLYSRRKRWHEDVVREIELYYVNVSQDQYSIRARVPSNAPLEPLDAYYSKVVRARQRGTVYPYELIKMLAYPGYPLYEGIPHGDFEEFDIEVSDDGSTQTIVSVRDREPGHNASNLVFGLITSHDHAHNIYLKRVIVLADPTIDLGSLAEPECRRLIAAVDLAEDRRLPVEWLPISSGAKIDMASGTENLDWTAAALRRIVNFTQAGGEINIIVPAVNVGAQSYWNAEATMLMHTRGLLIMTDDAAMLLTGKKALDFAGSVSGDTNLDIGGAEKIMGPNGQAQVRVPDIATAYRALFTHYKYTYVPPGERFPTRFETSDPSDRDITDQPYTDYLEQGFSTIGDIFSKEKNPDRKKPFDVRQVMAAVIDRTESTELETERGSAQPASLELSPDSGDVRNGFHEDTGYFERWRGMRDADTAIVWETRIGGIAAGLIGIESRNIPRIGEIPFDGPDTWNGGTLFPISSKKVARGINAFSDRLPLVILANLSGFDGSPESLRRLQLEYGAEIGRAMVNFHGPLLFIVIARYHGGAYVVFSKRLNPNLHVAALEGSFASVLGGAPAAAVVFPKAVAKDAYADERIVAMQKRLAEGKSTQAEFNDLYQQVYREKQVAMGQRFDKVHSVERAREVGSIDDIITVRELRPYIIERLEEGMGAVTGFGTPQAGT
jgi:acetyl/propionyl-CoA carboxylase alpha subunit/acetyl-CoA carboxylase carboxyltransferase component